MAVHIKEVDGDADSSVHKKELVDYLLLMFNGDWRSSRIAHYCQLGCRCGCRTKEEVVAKAKAALLGVIFATRPSVPALSRWLKCSKTAKWFWVASALHQILPRSFQSLYNVKVSGDVQSTLTQACLDLDNDLRQLVAPPGNSAPEAAAAGGAFMVPELPVPKIVRARALKAVQWIIAPDTLCELCVSVFSTAPAERIIIWLFKQQSVPWQGHQGKVFHTKERVVKHAYMLCGF